MTRSLWLRVLHALALLLLGLLPVGTTFASATLPAEPLASLPHRPRAVVGPGLYENNDPNVVYTNGWNIVNQAQASGGNYHRSSTKNKTARLDAQNAASFSLRLARGNNFGNAQILVDGAAVATIDGYNASFGYQMVGPYALPNSAPHTLTVKVLGTRNPASSANRVGVDYFLIEGAPTATPT